MNVCVVGGTSAIGRVIAEKYRAVGDTVWTPSRHTDVSVGDGPFNAVIVSVGAVRDAKLTDLTEQHWQESLDANLSAVFRAMKVYLPLTRDGGSVVVIGSIVGSQGGYGCAGYAAAKAGLVGLVRAAANENASRGVRVNLLELGYVDAGMGARLNPRVKEKILPTIPLRRFARVEEVIHAVDFLASSPYMTGNVLTLAGGLR